MVVFMAKYDGLSREELVELLQKQDKELARKKYGLVWDSEKEPEQVVLDCAKKLPILKDIKEKDIKTNDDEDYNIMIEGDNYHALQVLNYTHKGKIDVIYIDPPYNTGNKDFIYNDKFVDKEDGYRHSKWLNFMEKRLELAKELLKDDGVIFISIDDNEQANLKLLCDKVLGEKNFIGSIARLSKKGGNKGDFLKPKKDYVLVYSKNINLIDKMTFGRFLSIEEPKWKEEIFQGLKRFYIKGDIPFRAKLDVRPNQRYYIECPDGSLIIPPGNVFPKVKKDGEKIKPETNADKCWTWTRERYFEEKENNRFIFVQSDRSPFLDENGKKSNWSIYKKVFRDDKLEDNEFLRKEILQDYLDDFSNSYGTKELKEIDINFSYPKPVALVKYFIEVTEKSKDSLILDFFAGSGTTGHAVLDLNKQDGGNRRFILCTNNEGNIAEEVCYPRLKKVIEGYNKNGDGEFVKGLGGNLKYFKTDFVVNSKNTTQTKINLAKKCSEMLCLQTGIYNLIKDENSFKIFENNKNDNFLCVYFDFFGNDMVTFIEDIKRLDGKKSIFIFSLDDNVDKNLFADVKQANVEPIPQKILDVYRKIAKGHIKGDKYE